MPNIIVEWLAGRSSEQKAVLAMELTRTLSDIAAVDPDHVHVRFVDVSGGDWAIGGVLLDGTPEPE